MFLLEQSSKMNWKFFTLISLLENKIIKIKEITNKIWINIQYMYILT